MESADFKQDGRFGRTRQMRQRQEEQSGGQQASAQPISSPVRASELRSKDVIETIPPQIPGTCAWLAQFRQRIARS